MLVHSHPITARKGAAAAQLSAASPVQCSGLMRWTPVAGRRACGLVARAEASDSSQGAKAAVTTTSSQDLAAAPASQPTLASTPVQPATSHAAGSSSQGAGIAAGAVLAAVAAFAASNLLVTGPSLASLEAMSVPLEVALANGKPTVLEFYADWCEVCKELVPYEYEVQKQYNDKVNFVMLNIENSKWAQEAADFRVGGIPHFVFFDSQGEPLAAAVGRLPPFVLEGNVSALAEGERDLPYAAVKERTSSLTPPSGAPAPRQANPRDHA